MKRLSLLLAFSLGCLFPVIAQEKEEKEEKEEKADNGKNFFIGAGVQGDVYINVDAAKNFEAWTNPTFGVNVFAGKWINPKVGIRIYGEGGALHPFFVYIRDEKEKYLAGRLDVLINVTNFVRPYSRDRFYNLIPYVGIGGAYTYDTYHRPDGAAHFSSFMFGGGLWNTFRLTDNISAFANLGLNVVDAMFDGFAPGDIPFNGIASASIGLVYTFGKSKSKETIQIYDKK